MSDINKFNGVIQQWRDKPAATGNGEASWIDRTAADIAKSQKLAREVGGLGDLNELEIVGIIHRNMPTPPSSPPAAVTQQAIAILEELHAMAPCGPGPSVPFAVGDECAYDNTCKVHRRIAIAIRLLRAAEAQPKQD